MVFFPFFFEQEMVIELQQEIEMVDLFEQDCLLAIVDLPFQLKMFQNPISFASMKLFVLQIVFSKELKEESLWL